MSITNNSYLLYIALLYIVEEFAILDSVLILVVQKNKKVGKQRQKDNQIDPQREFYFADPTSGYHCYQRETLSLACRARFAPYGQTFLISK